MIAAFLLAAALLAPAHGSFGSDGHFALGTDDSLMVRGVSHALARYRAAHISHVRYALDIDVTRRDTAAGTARISFDRINGGDAIVDFRGYALEDVRVNGAELGKIEYAGAHLLVPATMLHDGSNTIDARFRSPIAPAGAAIIRFTDETDKRDYLYTLLVPADANLLFPCFDQPDLKAQFDLRLTVPAGWYALANGAVTSQDPTATTFAITFERTKPIPTYLFAFAAGPFAQLHDARNDITLWVRASRAKEVDADTLIALNRRARDWMQGYFGVPYPWPKLDFLLAPAFPFGGMEHPGAIFYNEESFIFREPPTLNQRLGRQATIDHEVAHQWFGDYTTMKWFDDLWMKEGFATYMAARMQAATGDSTAWMSFYLRNKPPAYDVDASLGTTPVWQELTNLDQAKSNYGAIVYNKAPGVLKQLNYLVGEDAFRRGVHDFLVAHAYGNATWQELIASVGHAARRDLTAWGRAYFLRPGMPVVEQGRIVTPGGRGFTLTQRPAQALSGNGPWPMKVQAAVEYPGGRTHLLPEELDSSESILLFPRSERGEPEFIYANAGDYGYGLFLLDKPSVDYLLAPHASGAPGVADVHDPFLRAMLWGSLWDMVRDARLDPRAYVGAATSAVATERDEQILSRLVARTSRALNDYLSSRTGDAALRERADAALLRCAQDSARTYGIRKNCFDAYVSVAREPTDLAHLDAWLDSSAAAGLPLRQPTRWTIATTLVARGWPRGAERLAAETTRDTTTGGKRRAFIAGAAFPRAETKREYFDRYFHDTALNEDWVTASLGAFNAGNQDSLTLPYLRPALDTLPWVQQNRRIFFLGAWLGAFISGQHSPAALSVVDAYLREHPELPRDLRQKVLQARDDLERTVRIRQTFD